MADNSSKLSITYSSGLIPSPEHMSTLAVFYDEIWLPYPCGSIMIQGSETTRTETITFPSLRKESEDIYKSKSDIFKPLFDEKNYQGLSRTKKSLSEQEYPGSLDNILMLRIIKESLKLSFPSQHEQVDKLSLLQAMNASVDFSRQSEYEGTEHLSLAAHALYGTKPSPELFISNPSDTSTSRLAVSLAQSIYAYMIPQLQTLNSEQILYVRDYLKGTKEGFAYYINEMTDDVKRRIRDDNFSDLEASRETFERKIQPQYEEFRRKLAAKKTGFWSKMAVAGGKFLQVDAAPWTPKFWGAVLELCGISLDEFSKSEQENFLSNQSQAFNYIATLSEVSKRLP